jgi:hypothetical protein
MTALITRAERLGPAARRCQRRIVRHRHTVRNGRRPAQLLEPSERQGMDVHVDDGRRALRVNGAAGGGENYRGNGSHGVHLVTTKSPLPADGLTLISGLWGER